MAKNLHERSFLSVYWYLGSVFVETEHFRAKNCGYPTISYHIISFLGSLRVSAEIGQVLFGACFGPGFRRLLESAVHLQVLHNISEASTRLLSPFYLGFRGLTKAYYNPTSNQSTNPIRILGLLNVQSHQLI